MVRMDEQILLRRAEDITYQSLGPDEDTVILCLRTGQLHTCNETTRAFLDALDQPRAFQEVFDRLYEQYEVAPEKLKADMERLLEELIREGIIVAGS
jgi:pyrroloquinoline quinone biosynthesis protein D